MVLFVIISLKYSEDVYFASFLQAFVFVTFNKGSFASSIIFYYGFSNNLAIFHLVHIAFAMPLEWFEDYWWCASPATDRFD